MMRPPPRFTLFPYPPLFGSGRGGGGAARGGGAGAVFATPAGIATIRHLSVEGGYQHFSDGSAVASGALALRAGRLSWGFGAAARDTAGALVRATDLLGLTSLDRKSTRLNSSHSQNLYAVLCLKKKKPAAADTSSAS